jgi:predicted RNase H-like HicB family nuclease
MALDRKAVGSGRYDWCVNDTLDLTIVYEADPDSGWIVASIPEVRGVHSQGRTRDEAREMVLSALGDWLRFYFAETGTTLDEVPADAERESVHLTFAA